MFLISANKRPVLAYTHKYSILIEGQDSMNTQKQNNTKIKFTIHKLLDEDSSDKTKIYKKIQNEFGLSQSEARLACKEVKIELMTKLKTLQSGMLEM